MLGRRRMPTRAPTPFTNCARLACCWPGTRESPDALDAHPLAREWFGEKLRQESEAGWKAAHGRLYEHLRDATKEGDDPDMKALEPLFQAISHGCKAGRQEETLGDVYINQIIRQRPDGRGVFHAQNKLGAIGPSVAALAWFFDKPFETPHDGLTEEDRSFVLGNAAGFLGALGRLGDACGAQRAALEMVIAGENWRDASVSAYNIADAELALGEVIAATGSAARAVELADRGGIQIQGWATAPLTQMRLPPPAIAWVRASYSPRPRRFK